jgi:DNA-binding transcriptional ArsR family regulator
LVDSAQLFEAISHPTRIRILKILEKQPASFAFLKRQLDIESSGNLDYHLKKLGQLIAVRQDGLYGLTDAGKEALLSIEAIDLWSEMERRKMKALRKVPMEAFVLTLLEFCTAAVSIFWLLSAFSTYFYGFLLYLPLTILGFASTFGVFTGKRWSWKTVMVKCAVMMFGSLLPLVYLLLLLGASKNVSSEIVQFYPIGIFYAVFVLAEATAVVIALRNPVKDFLGVKSVTNLSHRALLGGIASMTSGVLTIVIGGMNALSSAPHSSGALSVLTGLSFVGGLAVGAGGVLILSKSYILGALMSVVFGLFPYAAYLAPLSLIVDVFGFSILGLILVAVVGSLPIVGGILALVGMRKI